MNRKLKRAAFEMKIFCDSINVFTISFDQFITALMKSCMNVFKKVLLTPNF